MQNNAIIHIRQTLAPDNKSPKEYKPQTEDYMIRKPAGYLPAPDQKNGDDRQDTAFQPRRPDFRGWIISSRPWSFVLTVVSILAGGILSLTLAGDFSPYLFLLTLVGIIAAHAATNLLNDYFDTLYGIDTPGAPTALYRPHPLLSGIFSPRKVLLLSLFLYLAAALAGLQLTLLRGWPIIVLATAGGIISITYTAGPIHFKYRGLGEIFVFLVWGPLLTLGAYFVQTGSFTDWPLVLWASFPLGIWVALVLLANNLTDLAYDQQKKIVTVAILLGRKKGMMLFGLLLLLAYLLTLAGIMLGYFSFWVLLVFLSFPPALRLYNNFRTLQELPTDADPQTARISAVFGALLIFSILLGQRI